MPPKLSWFSDSQFIGREVLFDDDSIWRLEKKIREAEYRRGLRQGDPPWEARAVFLCTQVRGRRREKEAIIKARIQIPDINTENTSKEQRAKQALSEISYLAEMEKMALEWLTADNCTSTPHLLQWKQEKQTEDLWVPNGYLVYTLMTKVPGQQLERSFFGDAPRKKRDQIRAAFKEAWFECKRCHSLSNIDYGLRNLLWDEATGKIYIVDWEDCNQVDEWTECVWYFWGLLWREGVHPNRTFVY